MNLLVEIKDSKAEFVMELLKNFSFVKVKTVSPAKAQLMNEIKEAVENVKRAKKGELKGKPLKELLDEL